MPEMNPLNRIVLPLQAGALVICLLTIFACKKNITSPSPKILAFGPSDGPDSTLVNILGTGFGSVPTNNLVFFNGKQAIVTYGTDTTLYAVVPTLAGTGPLTVKVNGVTLDAGTFIYDTTWRVSVFADGLNWPQFLTIDPAGNLYVSTFTDSLIHKIDPQGTVTTFASGRQCAGLAADAAGNIYVAAHYQGPIEKFNSGGPIDTIAIDSSGFLGGMAVDNSGNVYIANNLNSTIDRFTTQGSLTSVGSYLYECSGLTVTGDGTIYTLTYANLSLIDSDGLISKVTPDGTATSLGNFYFDGRNNICLGPDGNIYLSSYNTFGDRGFVVRISQAGVIKTLISPNLVMPRGVAMDKTGHLYVVQEADGAGGGAGSVVKMTIH
jgi:sugar lactone lactonase YvrE